MTSLFLLDTSLETIAHIARAEKVKTILVESNFGDGMFNTLLEPVLRRIYPCTVEEVRSTGQKERRIIDTLEPVLNQHRLVVDAALLRADQKDEPKFQLFHQLTRITRDRGSLRHDDRLDALAMAISYWTAWLSRDVTREEGPSHGGADGGGVPQVRGSGPGVPQVLG